MGYSLYLSNFGVKMHSKFTSKSARNQSIFYLPNWVFWSAPFLCLKYLEYITLQFPSSKVLQCYGNDMPGVPYTLDSLISKQSEISADFKKMNRGFMACLNWLYFKIFCLFFLGLNFWKFQNQQRKRINAHVCLLESQEYQRPN